jgi:carbon monoxide dehydrogenase subunit G
MIKVTRKIRIESANPHDVFMVLSNPEGLTHLMPRLRKATLEDSGEDKARLTLCVSVGSVFGTICFNGNLRWEEPEKIIFRVGKPVDAEIHWTLTPADEDTIVAVSISLDLAPLLGPMAGFVPQDMVSDIIGKELEHALREIDSRLEDRSPGPESSQMFLQAAAAV